MPGEGFDVEEQRRQGEARSYDVARRLIFQMVEEFEQGEMASNLEAALIARARRELQHAVIVGEIQRAMYDLVLAGVLTFGSPRGPSGPTHLHLTPHGRRVAAASTINPYDPAGYLAGIAALAPGELVLEYVDEAVTALNRGLPRSAAVMIGAASEALIVDLKMRVGDVAKLPGRPRSKASEARWAADVADALVSWFTNDSAGLPVRLREQVRGRFAGYVMPIRESRNAAGHPASLGGIDRQAAYESLVLFPGLVRLWSELRSWMDVEIAAARASRPAGEVVPPPE